MFAILRLYKRCKAFNTLPRAGGIDDQDESTMALLEFVDGEVEKWKAKKIEEQHGDMMKRQMLSNKGPMPHG